MSHEPHPEHHDSQAAGNQFTLRGIFLLMTAVSVILALLALVIKQPHHWFGVLGIVAFCLAIAGILELGHRAFPPQPRFQRFQQHPDKLPPFQFPPNPKGTAPSNLGENPFAPVKPGDSRVEPADQQN